MYILKINCQNTNKISEFDLQAIYEMLSNGFPFKDILKLIENKHNKNTFRDIINHLECGKKVNDFFGLYLKPAYARHFNCFIEFESFVNSLGLAIKLVSDDIKTYKMYQKNLQYPLLILLSLILGVYMFDLMVFPSLMNILNQFNADNSIAVLIKGVLDVFCLGCLFILLLCLCVFMVVKRPSMQVKSYCAMHKYLSLNFIDNFISYDFVRYFSRCYEQGLSTHKSLLVMKQLKDKPLIVYIASIIDERLSSGLKFEEAFNHNYIDETLFKFMVLAVYTSSLDDILSSYLKLSELKVSASSKKLGFILQIVSYVIMTLVLVFVYQVLFLPLNIIGNL